MQWKLPGDAGVAELNGGDTAGEKLSWMDLQVEATAMGVRKVLGIGRVRNSENFFSAGCIFVSFSAFSPRYCFRLVFAISSCYCILSCLVVSSQCCRVVVGRRVVSIPCLSVPRYPKRLPVLSGGTFRRVTDGQGYALSGVW